MVGKRSIKSIGYSTRIMCIESRACTKCKLKKREEEKEEGTKEGEKKERGLVAEGLNAIDCKSVPIGTLVQIRLSPI